MHSKLYIPANTATAPYTVDVTPESAGWTCTPGATTTCTLDDLDGGDQTTLHVRVEVTAAAVPGGPAAGSVRADDAASIPIPAGMLVVLP